MRFNLRSSILIAAAAFMLPSAALPGPVSVNGSCLGGNCAGTDAVSYGGNTSSPFNFSYTVGSDTYAISGHYSAAYDTNGTAFNVFLNVAYTGSAPSTSNDTLQIDILQGFFDDSPGSWDGNYTEHIPFTLSGNVGAGSTVTAQLLYDGQSIGVVGPFGPGSYDVTKSADLTGLNGDCLNAYYQFIYNFAAGTDPGAFGATAAPEPTTFGLTGLMAALGGAVVTFSRRKAAKACANEGRA